MTEHSSIRQSRRPYHSPARQRQAEATRQQILTAARSLFAEHGYAGTTIEAIAEAAGISPKTVVAGFSSKRGVLLQVLDPAGIGSSHAEVLARLRAASDPRMRLALVARLTRDVYAESASELELLRGAGAVAPELAELSAAVEQRRHQQQAQLIELLRLQGALRADRTDAEATDEVWALTSFDLYRLLVLQSRWPPERYESWLNEVLVERVLAQ